MHDTSRTVMVSLAQVQVQKRRDEMKRGRSRASLPHRDQAQIQRPARFRNVLSTSDVQIPDIPNWRQIGTMQSSHFCLHSALGTAKFALPSQPCQGTNESECVLAKAIEKSGRVADRRPFSFCRYACFSFLSTSLLHMYISGRLVCLFEGIPEISSQC